MRQETRKVASPHSMGPLQFCQIAIEPKSRYVKVQLEGFYRDDSLWICRGGGWMIALQAELVLEYQGRVECKLRVD